MRVLRAVLAMAAVAVPVIGTASMASAEAPPGKYCGTVEDGNVCFYGDPNGGGENAEYRACGTFDLPTWLRPGNGHNYGVSSYRDNQYGDSYAQGLSGPSVVFRTVSNNTTYDLPTAQDKASSVRLVC